jgi:N-acetylneuraminate lyase
MATAQLRTAQRQHPTTTMADKPLFSGVIPALLTPHTESGELDTASIAPLVEYLIESGVNGFYVCGSTGEGMSMSVDERKRMLEGVMVACGGRVPVMVMVGACPIKDAVALAQHAHGLGVDAISTVAPGAYTALGLSDEAPPTFDASIAYFTAVGAATPLPFYPYWLSSIGSLDPRAFLEAMRPVPTFAGQLPLHSILSILNFNSLYSTACMIDHRCTS